MNSSTSTTLLMSPPMELKEERDQKGNNLLFDSSTLLQKQSNLPAEFIWPHGDLVDQIQVVDQLKEPVIDLDGFFRGDEVATAHAAELIRKACMNHGFFQVTNHGVDAELIQAAHEQMDAFFKLHVSKKLSFRRKPGGFCGYSSAHADRYSSKLPWKETFSFGYHYCSEPVVVDYFKSALGKDFEHTG